MELEHVGEFMLWSRGAMVIIDSGIDAESIRNRTRNFMEFYNINKGMWICNKVPNESTYILKYRKDKDIPESLMEKKEKYIDIESGNIIISERSSHIQYSQGIISHNCAQKTVNDVSYGYNKFHINTKGKWPCKVVLYSLKNNVSAIHICIEK